jgi:transposase
MMGTTDIQDSLFSYNVNLDKRVRADNPLRKVKELINFSFVREEVCQFYGDVGNPSVDPEIVLKMMFLLFFDNVPSERKLMDIIAERLDYMWFLGYGLDDDIPNHSVLSKARKRWGAKVFEELFVRTVTQCVESGLVDGKKLHFDGSLIEANASKGSVLSGPPELISALKEAYRDTANRLDDDDDPDTSGSGGTSDSKPRNTPSNAKMMCKTDPDAPIIRRKGLSARPRYKTHRAVDDQTNVITALETTPGDVEENRLLVDLIKASKYNTDISIETAVADAQYGTADNFRKLKRLGIRTHMADFGHKSTRKTRLFKDDKFIYDESSDTYACPAGQTLTKKHFKPNRQAFYYGGSKSKCLACSLREQCTRAKYGRTVMRHVDHDLVVKGRAESASSAAKRDRVRRKHIAEGSFADAANNHGFKRSRWRRLWRQKIQDYLIAACQNIRKLVKYAPGPNKTRVNMENATIAKAKRHYIPFLCSSVVY